jgi:FtsP/CotA-like multicopper oxidase with cupredoxin domain
MDQQTKGNLSRRRFVGVLSALGVGAVGLAACGSPDAQANSGSSSSSSSHSMTSTSSSGSSDTMTADEMDAMHEAGIKAFPAKTEGLGGQSLPYTMDGDTKVFQVTAQKVHWEISPGSFVDGYGYNGVIPGPEIRVTEGDKVRVVLTNQLDQSTSIHFHGLVVPNAMDGVPFITQPPVKPGASFTYEFVAKPVGTHMYHSHHNSTEQVGMGLLGPFIVEPKDPSTRPAFDREYTLVLNDGQLGFSLNGKGFPATQPLVAKQGERVLIRYMNEGTMIHPMHLHGMPMQVIAKDGYLQPQPWMCDTLNIAPGDRWEVIVHATEVGTWAFHCHILPHAESAHGMFGMVTALVVQ